MGKAVAVHAGHQSTRTVGSIMVSSQDPLVTALAQAVSLVLDRGIEVQPQGSGWFIRLSDQDSQSETPGVGRRW